MKDTTVLRAELFTVALSQPEKKIIMTEVKLFLGIIIHPRELKLRDSIYRRIISWNGTSQTEP